MRTPRCRLVVVFAVVVGAACRGGGGGAATALDAAAGAPDAPVTADAAQADGTVSPGDAPAIFDASAIPDAPPSADAPISDAKPAGARTTPDPLAPGLCEGRWCFSNPLPHGNSVEAMWGRAADDVWAVGPAGTILHWNGKAWSRVPARTDRNLVAVWGTADGRHVWVVGGDEIHHFDGQSWTKDRPPPTADGNPPYFNGVHGTAADDIWVVGHWGMVGHSDGRTWSRVNVGVAENVSSVWSAARNDVFVGVTSGQGGIEGKVLRFDGRAWSPTTFELPTSVGSVERMHGTGLDNLWAFGSRGILWRWRNGTWVTTPGQPQIDLLPIALFGSGPADMWIVHEGYASHFDGMAWRSVGTGWRTGWANAPGDAWLGGFAGRLARTDGTTVSEQRTGEVGELTSVWSSGGSDVLVGGTLTLKRGADGWSKVGPAHAVKGLSGLGPNDVWGAATGAVVHFDGTSWSVVEAAAPLPEKRELTAIVAFNSKDIWVVGNDGVRLHFDGQTWSQESFGKPNILNGLTAAGPDEMWAVGTRSYHWSRRAPQFWLEEKAPSSLMHAVWASAADDVWVVGENQSLAHWDGQRWTRTPSPVELYSPNYLAVAGRARDDVWAAGARGALVHWDGQRWSRVPSGTGDDLVGLWVGRRGDAWAVGKQGTILHFEP